MLAHEVLKKALYDHCLGAGNAAGSVEGTGVLQKIWVDEYLALLAQAAQTWGEQPAYPTEVVAAIQSVSIHLTAKYENWHRWTTGVNAETERLLAQVRAASERFLLARAARPADTG